MARLQCGEIGLSRGSQAVGVIASGDGEETVPIAWNLAITAAAHQGNSVLLVETDSYKSKLQKMFRPEVAHGFSDAVLGHASLRSCIASTPRQNVWLMPAGPPEQLATFDISSVSALLKELKQEFGWIVVHLPCPSRTDAGEVMSSVLDGVLLVVASERTQIETARRTKEQLVRLNANVLGVVVC
jgi:Mrp family chromosome partitioning ATPase